jgi:peptidoglycan/xylan/chitin deacetylase (PgdA/CDA1 family)
MPASTYRELTPDRAEEFAAKGYRRRHFFPHRIYYLPKCGPDGFRIAASMCGESDPSRLWELVLYADDQLVERFPRELFFDDELIWHRQQFGRPGQVATANLVLDGPVLRSMVHISDLVQRIARRPEHRTLIDNSFKGWPHMLLNGVMSFAIERGVRTVQTPTAELAIDSTDPARTVGRELFERVYDRTVEELLPARREGLWWTIDVDEARRRVVVPDRRTEPLPSGRTICVCHDIEHGLGHTRSDPAFAVAAHEASPRGVRRMLAVEAEAGCPATYNVLGLLFNDVRDQVEDGGHALAFHSYDHEVERAPRLVDRLYRLFDRGSRAAPGVAAPSSRQLRKCRELDYRVKGYRPPQSRIGPELSDANLCFHNFEWLASGGPSLGFEQPRLVNGLVKIPILVDDFDLYRGRMPYERWEDLVIETLERHDVGTVCLHDCYAPFWSAGYPRLVERVQELGRLVTMDELAAEVTLANAA